MAYLKQTSNHVSLSIIIVVIIHRQRSLMIIINRTRKDSCNNACVLLTWYTVTVYSHVQLCSQRPL